MQRPVCWRTRLHGQDRDFELARGTGENLVHCPARHPPNRCEAALIRDGLFLPRLLALSAGARRAFAVEGDIAYRVGSSSRRVGDCGASFSRAWRRTRLRGGVPAVVLESPRAPLRDPSRDLVSRPRPSLALLRVFARAPVRAVELHPVCTAFAPARHRTARTSSVSVAAPGTPAHGASFSPIIWRRAAPKRQGLRSRIGTRQMGHFHQPRQRLAAGV